MAITGSDFSSLVALARVEPGKVNTAEVMTVLSTSDARTLAGCIIENREPSNDSVRRELMAIRRFAGTRQGNPEISATGD